MTWRTTVNRGLRRLAGHQPTRAEARAGSTRTQPVPKPACGYPLDCDDDAKAFITEAGPYAMTSPERLKMLIRATRYVHCHEIPGDMVECGVWRGGSLPAAVKTLLPGLPAAADLGPWTNSRRRRTSDSCCPWTKAESRPNRG